MVKRVRLWPETRLLVSYLADNSSFRLDFDDLVNMLILVGLTYPDLADLIAKTFGLDSIERNSIAVKCCDILKAVRELKML